MDEDARMNDGQKRDRILGGGNASTLDSVGPVRGDQGMKVLREMNSLADEHGQFAKSMEP
jgi:hypothetical protein